MRGVAHRASPHDTAFAGVKKTSPLSIENRHSYPPHEVLNPAPLSEMGAPPTASPWCSRVYG